eukprot:CCRYP_005095-RA/>CCRYP_005095-RA protein AED:0.12 eAED:0.12 QI:177/1/1/1/1/1/3/279/480
MASSSSSSGSSSEDDKKVKTKPIAKKKGSSSSSSDSSDSDAKAKVAPKKKQVKKEESSSSDSDSEVEKAPPKKTKEAAKKKVAAKKEAPKKKEAAKKKEAPKKKESKKQESSSSSSESSESEDEAPAKKEVKKEESSSSSSDSSDSEEEGAKKKENDKKEEAGDSSSESDSSSDSEDEDSKETEESKLPTNETKKRKSDAVVTPENNGGDYKRQNLGEEDNTKVYVRGLPWKATEDEVRDFFAQCGEIASLELPMMDDGRSSGTAIIDFTTAEAAASAIEQNGADFNGRWLSIKYSSSKPIIAPREASQKEPGCTTVFVGNLSFQIDEDTLREAFQSCGEIASIRFAEDRESGAFKGFGHIEFVESESTDKAVEMAGTDILGRQVRVDYANDRRGGELNVHESFCSLRNMTQMSNSGVLVIFHHTQAAVVEEVVAEAEEEVEEGTWAVEEVVVGVEAVVEAGVAGEEEVSMLPRQRRMAV